MQCTSTPLICSLLQSWWLICRCPAPEKVIINHAVRSLVDILQQQQQQQQHSQRSISTGAGPVALPFADSRYARHAATCSTTQPPASTSQPPFPPFSAPNTLACATNSSSPPPNPQASISDYEQGLPVLGMHPGDLPTHIPLCVTCCGLLLAAAISSNTPLINNCRHQRRAPSTCGMMSPVCLKGVVHASLLC